MTPEELEAIRVRHDWLPSRGGSEDIDKLLAEVDRLRAQVAAVEAEASSWYGLTPSSELGRAIYYDNAESTIALAEHQIRKALEQT